MPRNAIDFSYARPSPEEVAGHGFDILVYTGPARPDKAYLDAMRAAGVKVTLIQETDPNRSQQGFNAGVADAVYADQRADEVGHPNSASIAYAVSDGSAGDPSTGADAIAAYAAGVASVSRRPFFFYGNQYATDAALRGAPNALGSWIPSSWGRGSLMSQEANIASPIADTDLNTVHADYTGGTSSGDDDLNDDQNQKLNEVHAMLQGIPDGPFKTVSVTDAVLDVLVGPHPAGTKALLAGWEQDTRNVLIAALAKDHDGLADAIVAKLPKGGGSGVTKADVEDALRNVLHSA